MPKTRRSKKTTDRVKPMDKVTKSPKLSKVTVANVNTENKKSNHAQSEDARVNLTNDISPQVKRRKNLNATVEHDQSEMNKNVEIAQFEEDGDLVQMEIDDGGAAAAEFASEGEIEDSDSESEDGNGDDAGLSENEASQDQDSQNEEQSASSEMDQNESRDDVDLTAINHKVKKAKRREQRRSMEEKIDKLSDTVLTMQQIIMKNKEEAGAGKAGTNGINSSYSDTTIYHNALARVSNDQIQEYGEEAMTIDSTDPEITFRLNKSQNRQSSSSEEGINTSDELIEKDTEINDRFIADCEQQVRKSAKRGEEVPSERGLQQTGLDDPTPRNRSDAIIREVEWARATMFSTPGKADNDINPRNNLEFISVVDENYIMVGAHIDSSIKEKIRRGEYINFARLLPRDKPSFCDKGKLELVNRGRQTYFIPAVERDQSGITSLYKWEQAFRVYANVYTKEFPARASELIEYNHLICTAANTFAQDNVYNYDHEFRTHMSVYPLRNWAVILQQAWSVCLKGQDLRK